MPRHVGLVTSVTKGFALRRRAKGWPIPPNGCVILRWVIIGEGVVLTSSTENDSFNHCAKSRELGWIERLLTGNLYGGERRSRLIRIR
jgi:hypothetical protein